MAKITRIAAREILNSRGQPTVETKVVLDDGYYGISAAPTGVSVSKFEAVELRDEDPLRFAGLGVLKAVDAVDRFIGPKLVGLEVTNQEEIDSILIKLDGTEKKSKLGVNSILPVSQSVLVAASASAKIPLWKYINQKFFGEIKPAIPIPLFNIINGGKHATDNLDFQEFLIVPISSRSFAEALQIGVEVYYAVKKTLAVKQHIYSVGDEGGFAPNLYTNAEAFGILQDAVSTTNYKVTRDLFLGLDAAANNFQHDSLYVIKDKTNALNSAELVDYYRELVTRFHLFFLEDPFADEDWEGWKNLVSQLGNELIVVGDDLLATNPKRLTTAIEQAAANAILVKPNQTGTVTETFQVVTQAKNAGWKVVVSHRSGDTNDTFIADLAVAISADYVKFGAPARGERVAKYNRLWEINLSLTK